MDRIADWLYSTDVIDEPLMIGIYQAVDFVWTCIDSVRCLLEGWCAF